MKVIRVIEKEIDRCFHQCPYFSNNGNEMVCEHPKAEDNGYIISHPQCTIGFPNQCPLTKTDDRW